MCISLQFYCWTKIIIKWCILKWRDTEDEKKIETRHDEEIKRAFQKIYSFLYSVSNLLWFKTSYVPSVVFTDAAAATAATAVNTVELMKNEMVSIWNATRRSTVTPDSVFSYSLAVCFFFLVCASVSFLFILDLCKKEMMEVFHHEFIIFCKSSTFRVESSGKGYIWFPTQIKDYVQKQTEVYVDLNKFDQVSLHLCQCGWEK